ncbi:MAG: VOC family protein [Chloroflexi bacterium]|nr:VOC family protein [Chloroflexota bacterium]
MAVKPVPEGHHTITPSLMVHGADRLIDFLEQAFGAKASERVERPDGAIMHAEVRIGDSVIMLGEPMTPSEPPMTGALYLYVNDADATYKRALDAGAVSIMEPSDQFWGDRMSAVKDAFGNTWWIATRVEDVPPEELKERAETFMSQMSAS